MTYEYMTGMGTTTVEQERLNQQNAQLEHERRLSQIQQGASGSIASLMASIGQAPPSAGLEQQSLCRGCYPEVIEPGRPTPPPRPTYPSRWRGSFADCAVKGGTTAWKSRDMWRDQLMQQVAAPLRNESAEDITIEMTPAMTRPRRPAGRTVRITLGMARLGSIFGSSTRATKPMTPVIAKNGIEKIPLSIVPRAVCFGSFAINRRCT